MQRTVFAKWCVTVILFKLKVGLFVVSLKAVRCLAESHATRESSSRGIIPEPMGNYSNDAAVVKRAKPRHLAADIRLKWRFVPPRIL